MVLAATEVPRRGLVFTDRWELIHPLRRFSWKPGEQTILWNDLIDLGFNLVGLEIQNFSGTVTEPNQIQLTWTYTDGSLFEVTLVQELVSDAKFTFRFVAGQTASYSFQVSLSRIDLELLKIVSLLDRKLEFTYLGTKFRLDYTDIPPLHNPTTIFDGSVLRLSFSTALTRGQIFLVDPLADGGGGGGGSGDPASLRGSGRRLFRDSFGKIFFIHGDDIGDAHFVYSNDPDAASPTFTAITLTGVTVAGRSIAATFKEAGAAADKALIGYWSTATQITFRQITINRDGSNNITGVTLGSVLNIAALSGNGRDISLGFIPSNGEVGAVWTENTTAGAKHARIHFIRLTIASPPTYRNLTGTASTVDLVEDAAFHSWSFAGTCQNEFDNKIWVVWLTREAKVSKFSKGALGGTFSVPANIESTSDDLVVNAPLKVSAASDLGFGPELVFKAMVTIGPAFLGENRFYGSNSDGLPAALGLKIEDRGLFVPESEQNDVVKGTAATRVALRTKERFEISRAKLFYQAWNGSAWSADTLLDDVGLGYITLGPASVKPYAEDIFEGIWSIQLSGGTWEIHYFQKNFAPPPAAAAKFIGGRIRRFSHELRYVDLSLHISLDKGFEASLGMVLEWEVGRTWEAIGLQYVPVSFSVRFAYGLSLNRAKEKTK